MFIIPYISEDEYKSNVDTILTLLSKNVAPNSIMLTEGEYSYIHNRHDVFGYAQKYNLNNRNHTILLNMINDNHSPWCDIKYIVCIGTWASDIIDNCFASKHPELTIIHIQGPILPKQYSSDTYENLSRFDTDIKSFQDTQIYKCQIQ